MRNFVYVALFIVLLIFTSCATIVSLNEYPLHIYSDPMEVEVIVEDKAGNIYATGVTPMQVSLKAGYKFFGRASYMVHFAKDGYETMSIPVNFSFDEWYIGNILLGGVIGMLIVDPATGAMWRLRNESINANLYPVASDSAVVQIMTIDQLDQESLEDLEKIEVVE